MKKKLSLLLVLVVIFVIFVVLKFFILNKQKETGELKIISSPTASIFLDSNLIGKTPYTDKYKVGDFVIKLIPEGTASDTASWNGKISIYKNALTYVNRELGSSDISSAGEIFTTSKMPQAPKNPGTGEIYVETEPQGAIITLDSDEKGVAPSLMENVPTGDHELSVFLPGFFRRTQKVNVDTGYRVNASFKLAIDSSQKTADQTVSTSNASNSAVLTATKPKITIKDTPTGWLRVRESPSIDASESGRVNPGESFDLLDEQSGWYKINVDGKDGWVSAQYSSKQ